MRYVENENSVSILRTVEFDLDSPSRADVAKHLGLSRAAITSQVNSLMALHLISEDEAVAGPSRGRPANPLSIDTTYWQVLGASLHDFTWEFVITDLLGKILYAKQVHVSEFSRENMLKVLIEGLVDVKESWEGHLLPAVGIGVPGVIDSEKGDIVFAYDFNWKERFNISEPVEKATGMKTYLMNRFTLEGVAEFKYANPEKIQDMIYIGVGSGIRSAIYNDGRLVEGSTFSAGRISHLQIDPNGDRCTCGRIGCLFTFASEKAIAENVRRLINKGIPSILAEEEELTSLKIARAADNGDAAAAMALEKAAMAVAKALVTISDILNPNILVIGGETGSSHIFSETAETEFLKLSCASPYVSTKVRTARISEFQSALGAASLVADHKLELASSIE